MNPLLATLAFAFLGFGSTHESAAPSFSTEDVERIAGEVARKEVAKAVDSAAAEKAAAAAAEAEAKAAAEKAAAEKAAADAEAEKAAAAREEATRAAEKAAREEAKADAKEAKAEEQENRKQIDTRVFRLNHASAQEVAEKFNEMWNGEFGQVWKVTKMAVAFPESNSIMVTAPRLILDACEKSVAELDVEAPQVYIEARFVELSNNASHKLGIDWRMLDGMKGSVQLGGGVNKSRLGKGVQNYKRMVTDGQASTEYGLSGGSGRDGDITHFNGTLEFSELYLILRALEGSEDAKVFSNPKIIVSSGKKATVDMTEKYPNVQISAKRTLNGNSESLDLDMKMVEIPGEDKFMFAKEAFFSWGIQLDVTPRIGTNGLINVSIVPTISSVADYVTAGTGTGDGTYSSRYPVIDMQRLVTEFSMASETTAVIGGLSRTVETQQDSGIPFLRDLPWLGPALFGSKIRVKEQKEIIVFVTVGLINPREMLPDAGLPKNAVLGNQYVRGQKLEPGAKPQKNMEGVESLDLRPLSEQARDPLATNSVEESAWNFGRYLPFKKDPNYRK